MYLNERCILLMKLLLERKKIKLEELTEKFQVSTRTIRYDLENINYILNIEKLPKIKKDKEGNFFFNIENERLINRIIISYSSLSSEERRVYLILKLFSNNIINLTVEAKQLGISRSTLKNDYNILKEELKEKELNIIQLSNRGLSLIGKENVIRKIFIKYFTEILRNKKELKNSLKKILDEILKKVQIEDIKYFIEKIQKDFKRNVSDNEYNTILSYLVIMELRHNFLNKNENLSNENFLKNTLEYKLINLNKNLLKRNISEYDLLNITDIFIGSHSYNKDFSFYENWIDIEIMVKKLIEIVSKELKIDLTSNKELLEGLLVHIKPTIYRIKNKINLENDIYEELIKEDKKLFEVIKKSLKILEEYLDEEISNQEISYIVIQFKVALENQNIEQEKVKNILFVCKLGYITSKIIAEKISEKYIINIVDTIPFHLLENYNYQKIDLIISTVEIEKKLPKKVIVISPLLQDEDLEKIEKFGIRRKKNQITVSSILDITKNYLSKDRQTLFINELLKKYNNIIYDDREKKTIELLDILNPKNIYLNEEIKSWEECILKMGRGLIEENIISHEYIKRVIEAIKSYDSYMVITPEVILPHAKNDIGVFKTGMSIMSLKEDIELPSKKKVKYIILFSSRDRTEHLSAMKTLVELISDYNFKEKLSKYTTGKEVIKYIESYKKVEEYV